MHKFWTFTSALALMVITADAKADEERWPRWYVGLSGGVAFLDESDISGGASGEVGYDIGSMGTAALGYMPPAIAPFDGLRFEAELGYHYHHLDDASVGGSPVQTHGHTQAVSYMGNIYYDIATGSSIRPYMGAGAGGATVTLGRNSNLGNTDRRDTVFAYQFMGGLSYAPTSLPRTVWSLGYRYFVLTDPEFGSASGPIRLDSPASHNVELGARFIF